MRIVSCRHSSTLLACSVIGLLLVSCAEKIDVVSVSGRVVSRESGIPLSELRIGWKPGFHVTGTDFDTHTETSGVIVKSFTIYPDSPWDIRDVDKPNGTFSFPSVHAGTVTFFVLCPDENVFAFTHKLLSDTTNLVLEISPKHDLDPQ